MFRYNLGSLFLIYFLKIGFIMSELLEQKVQILSQHLSPIMEILADALRSMWW